MPEKEFRRHINKTKAAGRELTSAGVLRLFGGKAETAKKYATQVGASVEKHKGGDLKKPLPPLEGVFQTHFETKGLGWANYAKAGV